VVVYDARSKPGGLNEYGIAAYKSVDGFAQIETDYILSIGGITLKHTQALGKDITLTQLKEQFDAVFLGLGLGAVNALGIEGDDLEGVRDAVDFIAELRQCDSLPAIKQGRRVVVIGGGMTAIDAAVQSKLLGAEEVTLVYRRSVERMNASRYEQDLAKHHGVQIRTGLQPSTICGVDGQVSAVEFAYVEEADGQLEESGESLLLNCDRVLCAIGQQFSGESLGLDMDGSRLKVHDKRQTSDAKIWAGGDCIAGGDDLTVAAVQDGKLAAESIHLALSA
jgi:glutamate synthase (NADPH/NADH) small chain